MSFEDVKDEVRKDEDNNEVHENTTGNDESSVEEKNDLSSKESKEETSDGNEEFCDDEKLRSHHKTRTPSQEGIYSLRKMPPLEAEQRKIPPLEAKQKKLECRRERVGEHRAEQPDCSP